MLKRNSPTKTTFYLIAIVLKVVIYFELSLQWPNFQNIFFIGCYSVKDISRDMIAHKIQYSKL